MATLPLGIQAWNRKFAGEAEIRLVNRFLEQSPVNLREKTALISRAGSTALAYLPGGSIRACFSKVGLFNGDLFVVSGPNLYRIAYDGSGVTPISGTLVTAGNGFVFSTWMKGIGYELMFVADGNTLQYYTTHAVGTLTVSGSGGANLPQVITDWADSGQVIDINGTYYAWSANVNPATPPAGTSGAPYLALLGSATPDGNGLTYDASSLSEMSLLLNYSGVLGDDYSSTVPAASPDVTAQVTDTLLIVTAIADLSTGNSITTTSSGSGIAWGAGTLTGGGNQALQLVPGMGPTEVSGPLANLSSYVLAAVGASQKFYWILPGQTIIDPLNFAEKESNPDNISEMVTIGDQTIICGDGSTENWYATGNYTAPFAPIEGRVYRRGVLQGTAVPVIDSLIVVGDDLKVYSIGYTWGDTSQYGVHRISTHGIEERIRTQVRSLQGLAP